MKRGASFSNGPDSVLSVRGLGQAKRDAGWGTRPVTIYDMVEGYSPERIV